MLRTGSLLASVALGVLVACVAAALTAGPGSGQTATATLVGAGDIASCSQTNDSATARLLGNIPGTVFTLGDNVYPYGSAENFRNCYDPTWGRYKKRTRPSLGNDLADNPSRCTMAYWHRPLYSTGTNVAGPDVKPFWRMLHARDADLIVNGHAHRYERFAPMTPNGARSAEGIRQIVAGTGGAGGGDEISPEDAPNLQRVKVGTFGVLKLSLRSDSYTWKFVRASGEEFTDSGATGCH